MRKLIFFLFCIIVSLNGYSITYYFNSATTGSDAGDDSRTSTLAQSPNTPWASISKLNSFFSSLVPGDSLLLKRGETWITTTGIIVNKSGSSGSQIVIGTYGSGAKPIVTSLVALSFDNLSFNLWRSREIIPGMSSINVVTINGIPSQMARWPQQKTTFNGGYNTINIPLSSTTITQTTTGGELANQPSYYIGAQIVYRQSRYEMARERITNYNSASNLITFVQSDPSRDGSPSDGWGYFIEDDSSILVNAPYFNAWWFRPNKYLKIYTEGTPTNTAAASGMNLVTMNGNFKYITFDNIEFNGCNEDGFDLNTGSFITIQYCIIRNIGRNGINLQIPNCTIINDSITDCLSKGITITHKNADHNLISTSVIRNSGLLWGHLNNAGEDNHVNHSGNGIYILADSAKGNIIEYCQIINSGYSGIHFKRQDSIIIRYNYIDSMCLSLDDGGGIYSVSNDGSQVNFGRRVYKNIVLHSIGALFGQGINGHANANPAPANKGIYADEWTNHVAYDSNTVAYCNDGFFANNGANKDTVRQSTFYSNSGAGIHLNTRSSDHTTSMIVTNNITYSTSSSQRAIYLFTSDYNLANFGTINFNHYYRPLGNPYNPEMFKYQTSTGSSAIDTNFRAWKVVMPYDASSDTTTYFYKTSVGQTDSLIFRYNQNITAQTTSLPGTYRDLFGATYAGSVTLQPLSSVILFLITSGIAPNSNPLFNIRGHKVSPK